MKLNDNDIEELMDAGLPLYQITILYTPVGPALAARASLVLNGLPKDTQAVIEDAVKVGIRAISEVILASPQFKDSQVFDKGLLKEKINEILDDDVDFFDKVRTIGDD